MTSPSIVVRPGQLESAVRRSPAGAVLHLSAGEHRLSRPLKIDKPLSFIGEGIDNTRIVGDGEPNVVSFEDGPLGDGPFVIRNLSFVHEGSLRANVVEADRVEIDIHRCRFNGGPDGNAVGLGLGDTTRGLVANCESVQNALGFGISGQAQLTLEYNYCKENGAAGIAYSGSAAGIARRNTCSGNESGIMLYEQAQPTLEANYCKENRSFGIMVAGQAQPTLEANHCKENKDGIGVAQQAQPTLEHNTCERNQRIGIFYLDSAAGIARHNACNSNRDGIFVGEHAGPKLESNACQGNTENDIYYASRTNRSAPQRPWGSGGPVARVP